ncbi:MAG: cytochrome c oxidase subunit 3 [Actinomycetota bacterium]|nr:cytochrome c oxidase subunit 3 [Actinomycetota bacterium]
MASTTPAPVGALPSAEGERPRKVLPMGVLLLATSCAMVFGTLIAAYLHLRRLSDGWPPRGVRLDLYLGNMLVITMLLSAVSMEWACYALRRGERRQACAALATTLGFGVAFLNLLWYTADRARFHAASHPYGLVVTALVVLVGIAVGIGIVYATLTLLRVAGRQLSAAESDHLRATACYWHFTVAACVAVWYTVAVLK